MMSNNDPLIEWMSFIKGSFSMESGEHFSFFLLFLYIYIYIYIYMFNGG